MRKLIIIRHCKSSWSNSSLSDFERPLNNRGLKDGELMSEKLSLKISSVDLLLSSSSRRTVLTSKFFIDKIKINNVKYSDDFYHSDHNKIIDEIQKVDNKVNSLMLIGHNPGLTYLVNHFSNIQLYNLSTAGIVVLDLLIDSWKEIVTIKNQDVYWMKFPKDYKS